MTIGTIQKDLTGFGNLSGLKFVLPFSPALPNEGK